jgi:hypothetical protein
MSLLALPEGFLSPAGPRYTPIARAPLGGRREA